MQPRKAILNMQPYIPPTHGRGDAIRLDFNENTIGCSPNVIRVINSVLTADVVSMYPEYGKALQDVSEFLNINEQQLMFTNGTDEAIQLLVTTFLEPQDELVIISPSYAMYKFYAQVAGVRIKDVNYSLSDNLAFPMENLLQAISAETKAIFLANPNNPTGTSISLSDIERIAQSALHALVLIDEAYVEFCGATAITLIEKFPNIFICRTMSKAYGMAGLRLGCLISQSSNIKWVRKAQSPYSVNIVALVAVVAAINDVEFIKSYVEEVISTRDFVFLELIRLGVNCFPSDGNFILMNVGERSSEIVRLLKDHGVLIRDRSHEFAGCLRVTIGTREQMLKFIQEMEMAL